MPLVGKPRQTGQEQAVSNSRYVASLYVARKKVWEGRAGTYEEASHLAQQEKQTKFAGTKSSIIIRESAGHGS